jgi:hypothetical protein
VSSRPRWLRHHWLYPLLLLLLLLEVSVVDVTVIAIVHTAAAAVAGRIDRSLEYCSAFSIGVDQEHYIIVFVVVVVVVVSAFLASFFSTFHIASTLGRRAE